MIQYFQAYFNSIKVQLELSTSMPYISYVDYFNSIKVQLELIAMKSGNLLSRFQFHKGTIRTR